jgi:uncharacterized membrane protein
MTRILCSECAGHVSAHARWCPHCGAPISRWKRTLSGRRATGLYAAAGCVLIAVGVIAAVYASADAAAGPMPQVISGITLAIGVIMVLLGWIK